MFYTQQQQRKQLTAYQVLVLFCRLDFGNSGQKNYFKKVSNILDTAFKTLETSGQSLNNFGIIATKCTMEANNGAMDQKSKLSNQFLFAKLLSNKTIVIVKKDFLEIYAMIITLWFPPVFTTGGQWLQLYEITALVRFKIAPAFAQTGLKC